MAALMCEGPLLGMHYLMPAGRRDRADGPLQSVEVDAERTRGELGERRRTAVVGGAITANQPIPPVALARGRRGCRRPQAPRCYSVGRLRGWSVRDVERHNARSMALNLSTEQHP